MFYKNTFLRKKEGEKYFFIFFSKKVLLLHLFSLLSTLFKYNINAFWHFLSKNILLVKHIFKCLVFQMSNALCKINSINSSHLTLSLQVVVQFTLTLWLALTHSTLLSVDRQRSKAKAKPIKSSGLLITTEQIAFSHFLFILNLNTLLVCWLLPIQILIFGYQQINNLGPMTKSDSYITFYLEIFVFNFIVRAPHFIFWGCMWGPWLFHQIKSDWLQSYFFLVFMLHFFIKNLCSFSIILIFRLYFEISWWPKM